VIGIDLVFPDDRVLRSIFLENIKEKFDHETPPR
jgi:hypothetical protein